jgi:hypothetical protein
MPGILPAEQDKASDDKFVVAGRQYDPIDGSGKGWETLSARGVVDTAGDEGIVSAFTVSAIADQDHRQEQAGTGNMVTHIIVHIGLKVCHGTAQGISGPAYPAKNSGDPAPRFRVPDSAIPLPVLTVPVSREQNIKGGRPSVCTNCKCD